MRLTHVNVQNILGIRSADVPLLTPVTYFAAANRNGKTSLAEAIRMALTGDAAARGVALKKDLQALVHDGQKSGSCEVTVDDATAFILLPSGKRTPLTDYVPPPALPYVLDAQRFAKLEVNERRAFLFGLMGLKATPEVVIKRLEAKGVDAVKAKMVAPLLRAGFADACDAAKKKATEAKGAWRAVTGETYGSVKAGTWTAVKPESDAGALSKAEEQLAMMDSDIADANRQQGALDGALKAHKARQAKVPELEAKIEGKQRAQEKLERDEAELAEWNDKVASVDGNSPAPTGMPCPCCQAKLVVTAGKLFEAPKPGKVHPDADKLPEWTRARDLMQRSVNNDNAALAAIAAAEAELAAINNADGDEVPSQAAVEEAQLALHDLREKRGTQFDLVEKMKADARAAAAADESTTKAAEHHANVVAWDLIAQALAPDGIPGEMLTEALEPFNARLEQSRLDAEWDRVIVTDAMEVLSVRDSVQRSYNLLSESEQWRADAMLAEAVSFLSGLKLVVLDRFDVLDAQGRVDLMAWMDVLASTGDVETALIFGTLKQPPTDLSETASAIWIEAGVAQLPEEKLAA